jgi:hypothetical protein
MNVQWCVEVALRESWRTNLWRSLISGFSRAMLRVIGVKGINTANIDISNLTSASNF